LNPLFTRHPTIRCYITWKIDKESLNKSCINQPIKNWELREPHQRFFDKRFTWYVEIKCQLDATEVFIADFIACSTSFGHHYAHHQELKSIVQWLLLVVFRAVVFKLLVWCGAEGYVSGLQDGGSLEISWPNVILTSHVIFCLEFFLYSLSSQHFIYLRRLTFRHLTISVFKWLSLCLSSVSFTWSCLFFIQLQAVQGCSVCWLGILKEHVWTRKPNLIPGLPVRVEDLKPTGYVVSSRKREDAQKVVGGGRRWRNCQWYREKILLDAGSKPAEIYTSLF